ncbi:MlaD protein [Rubritalea squalenifaciens DSM 18772]|uniref:MlaD protein n=1 Tax=Rubritalea squalenifaciens DSM 18772 TaxID=1123071 RepID=A0A1M6JE69_9BACT|nr:MlaD family protein [Rubritalea squalenifaciens]SHJ44940.1 MlaD protein [Rubritalea squalenifaciens DSM 18772]
MKIAAALLAGLLLGYFLPVLFKEQPELSHYTILLDNAGQLSEGSEVTYLGVTIGTVTEVLLQEKQPAVKIQLEENAPLINEADAFHLVTASLLGDRQLTITPGKPAGKHLPHGSTITAQEPSVDLSPFLKDPSSYIDLFTALSKLPEGQRKEAIQQCQEILKNQQQ